MKKAQLKQALLDEREAREAAQAALAEMTERATVANAEARVWYDNWTLAAERAHALESDCAGFEARIDELQAALEETAARRTEALSATVYWMERFDDCAARLAEL